MKIELNEDDIKQIILEKARAVCPTIEWEKVEIETGGYSYTLRKITVSAKEINSEAQ